MDRPSAGWLFFLHVLPDRVCLTSLPVSILVPITCLLLNSVVSCNFLKYRPITNCSTKFIVSSANIPWLRLVLINCTGTYPCPNISILNHEKQPPETWEVRFSKQSFIEMSSAIWPGYLTNWQMNLTGTQQLIVGCRTSLAGNVVLADCDILNL